MKSKVAKSLIRIIISRKVAVLLKLFRYLDSELLSNMRSIAR